MQLPTQFLVHRQTTMNSGDLFEATKHPLNSQNKTRYDIKLTPKMHYLPKLAKLQRAFIRCAYSVCFSVCQSTISA